MYDFLNEPEYQKQSKSMTETNEQLKQAKAILQSNPSQSMTNQNNAALGIPDTSMYSGDSVAEAGVISLSQNDIDNSVDGYSEGTGPGMSGAASGGGFMNSYGGAIAGGISALGSAIPQKESEFNNAQYRDETQVKQDAREKSVGATKDTVASVVGPWGQMFRAIEKTGNAAGDSIGGEEGAAVSALFSPDEAIMANNSDPDVKTGDKALGMIFPTYAAISSTRAKENRKRQAEEKQRKADVVRREQEWRMGEGQKSLERLTLERKAQLNYMNLDT